MKGTEQFKEIIKAHLDQRAEQDEMFRKKYETVNRSIEDIVTYIIGEVHKSCRCGWSDDEVFGLAVHAAEEPDLKIGKVIDCHIVSNRHIELTDEEKTEQKAMALKRFQDGELRKLQSRNAKPTAVKTQAETPEPSLFDF